jgi:hypothetical protein
LAPTGPPGAPPPATAAPRAGAGRYDRSIVEGPLRRAVWKLAWPAMLTNIVGGLQGIVDHALVGHLVGFAGNAAIGAAWQIFLVVIAFISSLFAGMGVLVARLAGAGDADAVDRTAYQAFPDRDGDLTRRHGAARVGVRARRCSIWSMPRRRCASRRSPSCA